MCFVDMFCTDTNNELGFQVFKGSLENTKSNLALTMISATILNMKVPQIRERLGEIRRAGSADSQSSLFLR